MRENKQKELLVYVYAALQEQGYDPIGQLVGYILSEDPTYITAHNGARKVVTQIDREELLKEVVKTFLEEKGSLQLTK